MSFWAVKTWDDDSRRDYWYEFLREGVVATGWTDSNSRDNKTAQNLLAKFRSLNEGDKVLLCRGYKQRQKEPVLLYGIAVVTGRSYDDPNSTWWRVKCPAHIAPFPPATYLEKSFLEETLQKRSLRMAIHQISESGFNTIVAKCSLPE